MSTDIATLGIRVDSRAVKEADKDLDNLARSGKAAASSASSVGQAFSGLQAGLAALGLGVAAKRIMDIADSYKNVQGRLSLVTTGTAELAQVTDKLYGIANRTRNNFEATADLYGNLARSTKSLGATQTSLLQITESVSQALIISGANAASSEAALRQLGQAFASGALRGDELNSIMENTPRIAQAIADGMDITVGQLRKLGGEGKLTAEAIYNALLSQQKVLEEQFAKMPTTIGQSFTVLGNAVSRFIGQADASSGASATIAQGIGGIARNIDTVIKGVEILIVFMGIKLVASFVAATAAAIAKQAALIGLTTTAEIAGFAIGALTRALAGFAVVGIISLAIVAFANRLAELNAAEAEVARTAADMKTKLDYAGKGAQDAAGHTAGLGRDALGSIPKIDAFGGRVGAAAQQLYNMARAAKAARVEMLKTDLQKAKSAEGVAFSATADGRAEGMRSRQRWDILGNAPKVFNNIVGDASNILSNGRTDREAQQTWSQATRNSIWRQQQLDAELKNPVSTGDLPSVPIGSPVAGNTKKTKTGGGGKSEAEKAADEAKRKQEEAIKTSKEFADSLKEETSLIGKNNIETKLAGIYKQAQIAPTKALSDAIMEGGKAWLVATEAQANAKFKQELADQVDTMKFENSLLTMNAAEREKANIQHAIEMKIRDAKRDGITLDIAQIKEETAALMHNIDVKHSGDKALEGARETASAMREAADSVGQLTEGFSELFGTAGTGFENLINTIFEYGAAQAEIAEKQAEISAKYSEGIITNTTDQQEFDRLGRESAQNRIASYGNMIGAAKTFFKEGSTGYKVLEAAERAYKLFQFAMQIKSIIMDTIHTGASVANSGVRAAADGTAAVAKAMSYIPPPFNFVVAGAVIAFLIAMGVKMAGGKGKGAGGGGASSGSSTADKAKEEYIGPRDQYGAPTSSYSVLRPGATTVANDNITPYGASAGGGGGFNSSVTLVINGGADMRTIQDQVMPILDAHAQQTVQDARQAVAADQAARAGRQSIGGGG